MKNVAIIKLERFLAETGKRPVHIARDAGLAPSTVTRFMSGERGAGVDVISKLIKATDGALEFQDFFEPVDDGAAA